MRPIFGTHAKILVVREIVSLSAFTRCVSLPVVLINLESNHIMSISFIPVVANLMGPQSLFIMLVLLLLFGAKKLPELAKGLGQAIREFSKAKNDITDEIMREQPPTPTRQIETPVQTAAVQPPAGTQPTGVEQRPAAPAQHTGTHA
jgi:sec-independent protein translocase protein TatA